VLLLAALYESVAYIEGELNVEMLTNSEFMIEALDPENDKASPFAARLDPLLNDELLMFRVDPEAYNIVLKKF